MKRNTKKIASLLLGGFLTVAGVASATPSVASARAGYHAGFKVKSGYPLLNAWNGIKGGFLPHLHKSKNAKFTVYCNSNHVPVVYNILGDKTYKTSGLHKGGSVCYVEKFQITGKAVH